MAEVLNMSERIPELHYVYHSGKIKSKSKINIWIRKFYEYGTYLCEGEPNTGKYIMERKNILRTFSHSDIIVFNLGLHYDKCSILT